MSELREKYSEILASCIPMADTAVEFCRVARVAGDFLEPTDAMSKGVWMLELKKILKEVYDWDDPLIPKLEKQEKVKKKTAPVRRTGKTMSAEMDNWFERQKQKNDI